MSKRSHAVRSWTPLLAFVATIANAQGPAGADMLALGAVADSQAVLSQLTAQVRANRADAAAWHRIGMVAWALRDRARAIDPPRGLDATRLGKMADTSLRIAAELEPKNVQYRLMVGRFLIASGAAMSRSAAGGFFESALSVARETGTPRLRAAAALEYGRVFWRRYDAFANRRMVTSISDVGRSLSEAMQPVAKVAQVLDELFQRDQSDRAMASLARSVHLPPMATADALMKAGVAQVDIANALAALSSAADPAISSVSMLPLKGVRELIEAHTFALPPGVAGGTDFARADSLFSEAYAADPSLPAAFRCAAMMLAEKNRWRELETFARAHLAAHAKDGPAWMSLALAMHRQGDTRNAGAVFDTAMTMFDATERRRLESLLRVVASDRERQVNVSWQAERDVIANMFWMANDPLWSDGTTESRTEFRARVTFAELRWTLEEAGIRGAETDRGDVYIRYGPPDLTAVIGPSMVENAADVMTFWMYRSGLMFAFSGLAGFGTSRIPLADRAMVAAIKDAQPVRWDNLPVVRPDSIFLTTARFRATPILIDVYVAALPPVDAIRASMTGGAPARPVRGDVWLLSGSATLAYRDSVRLDSAGVRSWSARVEGGGDYLVRVEATAEGTRRSARGSVVVDAGTGFPTVGPGLSDVLIAASATQGQAPPTRWRDLTIVPAVGAVARGQEFALIWENYEFGDRDGSAQYEVAVTITRQRSALGNIAASVVGALAGVVRVETRPDRMVLRYDRMPQHAAVIADNIAIALGTTPPGTYTITLDVTDRIRGATYSRSANLIVRE